MHGYTLLVPMNQRMLRKSSKMCNITGYKRSMTQNVYMVPAMCNSALLYFLFYKVSKVLGAAFVGGIVY